KSELNDNVVGFHFFLLFFISFSFTPLFTSFFFIPSFISFFFVLISGFTLLFISFIFFGSIAHCFFGLMLIFLRDLFDDFVLQTFQLFPLLFQVFSHLLEVVLLLLHFFLLFHREAGMFVHHLLQMFLHFAPQ